MLECLVPLPDVAATEALGGALAKLVVGRRGGVVTLRGDLGSGKTTLARACLRALGAMGAVKSPTYTLVEPYDLAGRRVLHMDLYRLADPEELYNLGLVDDPPSMAWWLVEWPEKAGALLPPATLEIHLQAEAEGRSARLEASDAEAFPVGYGPRPSL